MHHVRVGFRNCISIEKRQILALLYGTQEADHYDIHNFGFHTANLQLLTFIMQSGDLYCSKSCCWNLEIKSNHIRKDHNDFYIQSGMSRFLQMLLCVKRATSTFNCIMHIGFSTADSEYPVLYQDDLFCFGVRWEAHGPHEDNSRT